jgi:hypothetical protein
VSQQEPSEEELRAALEEQMRHVRVEDVLVQTAVTLINLGARRLGLTGGDDDVDQEQARLSIEGARALMPLLPEVKELGPVRDALSQLQMAYVQRTADRSPQTAGEAEPAPQAPSAEDKEAEERAKARAKLWTPPGS